MDIAKYIGQFLLKNHFCYIHGLGNMELRKKPANFDGSTLHAPAYEVVVTPGGSIDDNLANFIATNEFISISKASNALRDFSTYARAELNEGNDVIIPNIGKYHEDNGKITFITDANLQYTPQGIPALKTSRRIEEERQAVKNTAPGDMPSYKGPVSTPSKYSFLENVNWMKVGIAAVAAIILLAGAIAGYFYIRHRNSHLNADTPVIRTVPVQYTDTVMKQPDSAAMAAAALNAQHTYLFIIEDFKTLKKAASKVMLLRSYGHNDVQAVTRDSSIYYVVLPVKCNAADTIKIMDTLSRYYGYPGVSIYQ